MSNIPFTKKFLAKLTSIIRNFGGQELKKNLTPKAYVSGHGLIYAPPNKMEALAFETSKL
jgi:hypothetical protein